MQLFGLFPAAAGLGAGLLGSSTAALAPARSPQEPNHPLPRTPRAPCRPTAAPPTNHCPPCSCGGVVVTSADGKIVCSNTLDDRLRITYQALLPEVRAVLFGAAAA